MNINMKFEYVQNIFGYRIYLVLKGKGVQETWTLSRNEILKV